MGFPIVAGAMLGGKLLGGLFGKKKKPAEDEQLDAYDREFDTAVGDAKGRASTLEGQYDTAYSKAGAGYDELGDYNPEGYDAGAAYKEYAGGVTSDFNRVLGQNLKSLRQGAAGAGRLDTGMFDEDSGDVATEVARGFSSDLARGSLQAAGITSQSKTAADQMRLSALTGAAGGQAGLAGLGLSASEGASNRYLDTLTAATNRKIQKKNAATQAGENKRRGIFDFLGGAAKTILPYVLKSKTVGG